MKYEQNELESRSTGQLSTLNSLTKLTQEVGNLFIIAIIYGQEPLTLIYFFASRR